jgi:hypothetical protein
LVHLEGLKNLGWLKITENRTGTYGPAADVLTEAEDGDLTEYEGKHIYKL